MIRRNTDMWLPSALLLLQVSGCLASHCPCTMTGTVGASVSLQCQYEKKYQSYNKYCCRGPCIQSQDAEGETEVGQVSIRDYPTILTFTMNLEPFAVNDTGTYQCNIYRSEFVKGPPQYGSPIFCVVSLSSVLGNDSIASTLEPSTVLSEHIWLNTSGNNTLPRFLLSSTHFVLLLLLVPLLGSMLSAVFWVNRSQKHRGREENYHNYEN